MKQIYTAIFIILLLLGLSVNMHTNILDKFCSKHPKLLDKFNICRPICEYPLVNGVCEKPMEGGNL